MFGKFVARAPKGRFGSSGMGFMSAEDGGGIRNNGAFDPDSVRLRLPPWCLRRDGVPPLAALVALMDEASSYAMALRDKRGRFGVSILLQGSLLRRRECPGEVVATTTVRKLGRTIGFADVEVRCAETDAAIARGKHVKFLHVGNPLADNAATLARLPGFESLFDAYVSTLPLHAPTDAADVPELFGLRDNAAQVVPALCNPWGSLHGGAACVLAEHVAQEGVALSLTATFLSAIRSPDAAVVQATPRTDDPAVVHALVSSARSGAPSVDVTLRYAADSSSSS